MSTLVTSQAAMIDQLLADVSSGPDAYPVPPGSFIAKFEQKDFIGLSLWDGRAVHVALSGSANIETRQCLRQLLADVHAAAKAWGATEAVLWLRQTRFLNSSCISAILGWMNAIESEHAEERYAVRVVWDPQMGWERRTMAAIHAVMPSMTLQPPL